MELVIIDLRSQVKALRPHLQGWTKEEIIIWLSQYGKVEVFEFKLSNSIFADLPEHFIFTSRCGLDAVFYFGNDNSLQVIYQWES